MLHILPPLIPPQTPAADSADGAAIADRSASLFLSAGGFEATVLCAVGEQVGETIYLAYLSLLGPGTTVVALWATLMDHRNAQATLEDDASVIGRVQLWQRRPDLADLGYRLSWRRRHTVLSRAHGARLVHLVTEPDLLTCRDPEQVESGRRRRRGSNDPEDAGGSARGNAVPVVPAPSPGRDGKEVPAGVAAAGAEVSGQEVAEQVARETRPLFLLLGQRDEDLHALACRHLLFLAERIQWLAYYEPWADALWGRARQTGEAVPLTIWPNALVSGPKSVSGRRQSEQTDEQIHELAGYDHRPWIADAWFCRPQPLALAAALRALITDAGEQPLEHVWRERDLKPVTTPQD